MITMFQESSTNKRNTNYLRNSCIFPRHFPPDRKMQHLSKTVWWHLGSTSQSFHGRFVICLARSSTGLLQGMGVSRLIILTRFTK